MAGPGTIRPDANRLTAGYSGRILLIVSLCSVTSTLGWLVIPPLLPTIIEGLEITATQAGLALSLLTGLSAVMRYPGGRLADQLSRKTVLAFSIVAWIAGFSILAVTVNYVTFLIGVMLVGIGLGAFVPAAFAQLSDLFDRKQGRAFGVNNAAFSLGGILASGLAIAVLAIGPWRLAFLPAIVTLLGILLLLHRWSDQEYVIRRVDLEVGPTIGRLVVEPRIRILLVVAALFAFVWNGAIAFLPTFLEAERGLSTTMAGVAFASVFLTGVVATPLSGALGDRFGTVLTILGSISFAVAGLCVVIVAPSSIGVVAGVVVFSVGLTGFWPVMTSYMMSVFPEGSKGGDYGAIGTVYMAAGSVGPTYVGATSEYVDYTGAYLGLGGCLLVCLVLIVWLRSRSGSRSTVLRHRTR